MEPPERRRGGVKFRVEIFHFYYYCGELPELVGVALNGTPTTAS